MQISPDALLREAFRLHQSGKLRSAEAAYRKIIAKNPRHVDANNLLGLLCIQTGRFAPAVKWIESALQEKPDDPQAHYNLGIALKEVDRLDDAAIHFQHCVDLDSNNVEAYNGLGNILRIQGQHDRAVTCFEKALAIQPAHADSRRNFSLVLNDQGVVANKLGLSHDAIRHFRRAVELTDTNPEAHINLGITFEQTGKLDQAASSFKNAISARPVFAEAHYHLAHLRSHRSTTGEIDAMQSLFDQPGTSDSEQTLLAYGLGEAHHKLENYDNAFEAFATGHRLKKKTTSFNLADHVRFIESSIEVFDTGFFDEHRRSGYEDKTPIFILGMPRSGTSLTEQILASQSTAFGAGERIYLPELVRESVLAAGNPYPQSVATLSHKKFRHLGKAYVNKLRSHSQQTAHISDTTPMNFLYVGLIAIALPNARIIHCLRNPLDTCLSIFMHPLSTPHSYAHELENLGAYYKLYQRLMAHWHSMLPGRIHDVMYEQLVTDSETEIRALLNYCELPFEKACLNFHETERTIRTPSAGQVRQPMYDNSIRRWKHYEKHLGPLIELFEIS